MKTLCPVILALVAALFVAGCGGDERSLYQSFDAGRGWAYADTLAFRPQGLAAVSDMSLVVRHTIDYPYSNIWLEVGYTDASRFRRDTLNVELADVYGRWLGKGFGANRTVEVDVRQHVAIKDSSVVSVRHIMRADTLRGVEHIGIILNPAK